MLIIGEALYEWGQGMHGKSVPSSHFCCKPKIALLKMSLKKIIKLNMELHGKCQSAKFGQCCLLFLPLYQFLVDRSKIMCFYCCCCLVLCNPVNSLTLFSGKFDNELNFAIKTHCNFYCQK